MKKLNKYQILGILIAIGSLILNQFSDSNLFGFLFGALMALGLALILKWFPISKEKI
ncbi:hypothetical protein [Christiangramia aquimixticola]|uniref:hypothetical protein n=1 Tax=Christiangramia aquimixticola TaxID=1697558 RepID=UPI003AA9152A